MSNMTMTPTNIQSAVYALGEYLEGVETQVFWAPLGAVVLTDNEVFEVYESGDDVVIQARGLELQTRWEDITGNVLSPEPEHTGTQEGRTYGDLFG